MVMFPLALGQTAVAEVVATSAGLIPGTQPQIVIALNLNLPAAPNGQVPGVHAISVAPAIQP